MLRQIGNCKGEQVPYNNYAHHVVLTRLANKKYNIISEDGCVSIKKIRRQLHHHW